MHEYGFLALIPPLVVIVFALWMRRSFEPLLIGCVVGYAMIAWHGANGSIGEMFAAFPANMIGPGDGDDPIGLYKIMMDEANVWVILVCGLYGSLIYLLLKSGSIHAFGQWMLQYAKDRRSAKVISWLLGLIVFIDDYMSALSVGVTMRKITDRYNISREMLALLVNTMAAPLCLIVPLTTWTIYVGGLLEENQVVAEGDGLAGYWATIPYMFYAWAIVIIGLLVALDKFPLFKRMKLAEERAQATGQTSPDGSQKSTIQTEENNRATHWHFILPLLTLIGSTLLLDNDALKGVMLTIVLTMGYYWFSKLQPFDEMADGIWEGFNTMVFALAILMMSYLLKDVNDQMGLTQYVIDAVKPFLPAQLLPVGVFISMGIIAALTASNWGLYAVAIPIVVPLAQVLGADVWLTVAALVSAGGFGSQTCFYSDTTVLTTNSTECHPIELMFTQLPYTLTAAGIASVLFVVFGYML